MYHFIFGLPIFAWVGVLTLVLIFLQILIGRRILKLPFFLHRKVIWVLILIFALIHAYFGLMFYLR